jgi:putative flippase GtrA
MTLPSGTPEQSKRVTDLTSVATGLMARVIEVVPFAGQLSRYTVASVFALAADFTVYLGLAQSGMAMTFAAIIGYTLGMLTHYVLSSRWVFNKDVAEKSETRLFSEFAVSGAVGLVLTVTVIAVAEKIFFASPFVAKLAAVGVSFFAVFFVRRCMVFKDQ